MRVTTGLDFLKKLHNAGLIPRSTRRVIIDADVEGPLRIFSEQAGDECVLDLDFTELLRGGEAVSARKLVEEEVEA